MSVHMTLGMTRRRLRAFTLIELLVVMAVLGILAMAVFPLAEIAVQRDREHELKRALWEIRDAIDAYKKAIDGGSGASVAPGPTYPPNLVALVKGIPSARASGEMLYFLRRVPRDPFADPALPAEKTWGFRSFASSAEAPRPGADVYDVYSLSDKIGLNGVPLKEW